MSAARAPAASLAPPPAGWTEVTEACSEPVGRTRVLLCKTPLSSARWAVPAANTFTPQQLLQQQRKSGRALKYLLHVSVRASGTASDADRSPFIDPAAELRPGGCQFVHFQVDLDPAASTPAAQALDPRARPCPISHASIAQFVTLLRGLLASIDAEEEQQRQKKNSGAPAAAAAAASSSSLSGLPGFVAISDVYGYNLSAFLLCCYLATEGMDVTHAISDVGDARPPGIYVAALLQALLSRYFEPDEEAMVGGMQAAAASGAPGNKAIARLTCIPLIPDLPRPEWHRLPWTWSGLQVSTTAAAPAATPAAAAVAPVAVAAPAGVDASTLELTAAAAAEAAAAGAPAEEFKRKIRKKAPPPAPVAIVPSAGIAAKPATAVAVAPAINHSFAGSSVEPAAKRARVEPPPMAVVAPAAAVAPPRSGARSPQPLFQVPPPAAVAPVSTPSMDPVALAAQLQRDHPFLERIAADKIPALEASLAQIFPAAAAAKFKPVGSLGNHVGSFLRPPTLTSAVLNQVLHAPAAARAPYLLSWLPQHHACLLLVLREAVYALFHESGLWFHVPHLRFPKRKNPAEFVNNTLLLGELILDPAPSADGSLATMLSRFLATDLLVMSQTILLPLMPLEQRLATLDTELLQPLKSGIASGALPQAALHLRCKAHFALAKVESVMNMQVPHVHEGVTLRMSGKEKDAAKSAGYTFVWRKVWLQSRATSAASASD